MYAWGATAEETHAVLPGDELVEGNVACTTRAVTIAAPPAAVWSWLAQIGEDRGGFYSYDVLERVVGARMHNADRIHPEWQRLDVGDTVWLAQRFGRGASQVVAMVEPGSYLVMTSPDDFARVQAGKSACGTWSFSVRPHGGHTRLVARGRGGWAGNPVFDIAHFIMERKMLLGLAERVSTGASAPPAM
jgi:hypothetical protein